MQRSSSILLLIYFCLSLTVALDFGHVDKFLWWKNKDPPKWWPGKGGKNNTNNGNNNGGGDPDDTDPEDTVLNITCSSCISRMKQEAKFKWESVSGDDWVDERFPPNQWALYFEDPYSEGDMSDTLRTTVEFKRVSEGDEVPDPALWFNGAANEYYLQAD
mmetsp:Transcript_5782/g.4388  ORF Transcript_5782/g.4388 Transcript_5782/m.4388 type:complete len:160 (-) Transcript_5782:1537-2016(-)